MERIGSAGNARIKRIRALRGRKKRERSGLFLVEGLRVVREAVETGAAIETLVVAPELLVGPSAVAIVEGQRRRGGRLIEVSGEVFRSISGRDGPQGVAAVVRQRWEPLPATAAGDECWVALHGVQHPGNLGAVLRSCDASGAAGVILIGATTDPHDPIALRASTGAIFSQRLVRASIAEFCRWIERGGRTLIGASGLGASDYRAVSYRPPLVLLMGAERNGLPDELLARCDAVARIPMVGRADSLNLAVATALMLYEVFRAGSVARRTRERDGVA